MHQTGDGPEREGGAATPAPALRPSKRRIASAVLLGAAREVIIEHAGEEYQLRVTKNGKLLLTK